MATFDLDEQEQLDALQQFWRSYGRIVMAVVLAVVVGFGSTKWWEYQNRTEAQSASATFNKLEAVQTVEDIDLISSLSEEIISEYGDTYYADLARLNLAKTQVDVGNPDGAIKLLRGVVDDSRDSSLVALARLRLAALYVMTEQFDLAMSALDGDADAAMSGLFADIRGDIYAAQGLYDEARGAYQEALSLLQEGNPWVDIVQIKIDSLGSQ
ncbi:MAG: tetratricopeptide repeat protein [Proteobacteria bacterium]|nr:tetratricopeptide repeat protein [Pseudomonadota bacterium]MDA0861798.1 tetratricopeptide repeat protein [Pseudomonadota bacterium]MDA1029904.1 tetratricopeptide repeat protein [Pseudomonadota bacterium]